MASDPLASTAVALFFIGVAGMFVMCVARQRMSVIDSALAMVGVTKVKGRDWVFNLVHFAVLAVPLVLLCAALVLELEGQPQ